MLYLNTITALLVALICPVRAIVNGTAVTRDAYEFTVAILQPGLKGARQPFICNGVLISEFSVMTSAECVQGLTAPEMAVRVGFNNTGGFHTINVNDVVTMAGFTYTSLSNDVAILNLTQAVTNITPANLATNQVDGGYPNGTLRIVGWGGTVFHNTDSGYQSLSPVLRTASVNAIAAVTCEPALRACEFNFDSSQRFCTSSTARGAAGYGDAGGAVVDSQGIVVGLMTGNPACAQPNNLAIQLMMSNAKVQDFVKANKYGPA